MASRPAAGLSCTALRSRRKNCFGRRSAINLFQQFSYKVLEAYNLLNHVGAIESTLGGLHLGTLL